MRSLTNDYIGSREVNFIPKVLTPGTYSADPATAGAITLMVQASLIPCLLSSPCHCSLKGGTNVAFSPPFEFCRRVFLPALERMGACVDAVCDRRGFYPRGGGFSEGGRQRDSYWYVAGHRLVDER